MTKVYNASLSTPATLDMDEYFPQGHLFEEAWETIRAEALAVAQDLNQVPRFHDLMPEQYELSSHGNKDWRMFILKAYGHEVQANMQQCPALSRLLASAPAVVSASLSFLAPGKQVPVHTGPFRGIVRFYMGVFVPLNEQGKPAVILTIDGNSYSLSDGQALLWDDTYPHSVANNTDDVRIALLLDVYRAHMSLPLKVFSNFCIWMAAATIKMRKIFPV